ncbi:DEAD/DEAH box helicase [Bacillus timonensis]|nr:DEAD/DEAH box helicase [Bacillus timonensis]
MRFYQSEKGLVPEPLASNTSQLQPISKIKDFSSPPINHSFSYCAELQSYLQGKQLLLDDLHFSLQTIHTHYENGYILYRKGITRTTNGHKCERCGNEAPHLFASFHCERCHQPACTYCRKCIMMGRVSECTPLISWTGPFDERHIPPSPLNWDGTLSSGQRAASDAVIDAIQRNDELLVWAVCGAGKTEVLFHGIETALAENKRVCIATPRTDVVIELGPRIQRAFPQVDVVTLYGGSEDRTKTASLTLSTTHQLLRYYRAFDVIIIDEVDAFPYSAEPMLEYAVNQAKKEVSTTIYLTATPNLRWQKEVKKGKRKAITIPARYHRNPLPVPSFKWCGNWRKLLQKNRLPANVLSWIHRHLLQEKQAFLFVPHIESLEKIVELLQKEDCRIEGVHSKDSSRKEKIQAFRDKRTLILVTTTILERGVTVPNVNVAILGADDGIFTESALVQISGRVGRSSKYPTGEILFYHYGKTNAMLQAKKHILKMNHDAVKRGLIGQKEEKSVK